MHPSVTPILYIKPRAVKPGPLGFSVTRPYHWPGQRPVTLRMYMPGASAKRLSAWASDSAHGGCVPGAATRPGARDARDLSARRKRLLLDLLQRCAGGCDHAVGVHILACACVLLAPAGCTQPQGQVCQQCAPRPLLARQTLH